MILTNQDDWVALYNSIKEESRRSEEKFVFIYASAQDCDSLCALRILERLFMNDRVPHGSLAVTRYDEISADFFRYYKPEETAMRTAVLINCGAAEDVRQLLELDQRPNVRVVIVDSHRPICHTANLEAPADCVHVLLDEGEGSAKGDIPPYLGSGDWDGGGDSDLENDEGNLHPSRRRRTGSPTSSGEGRSRHSDERAAQRKERERQEELRKQYYSKGCWFGKPAACVIYDLAYYLQMNNSFMLWLALVGLTDHLVHFRIPAQKYNDYYFHYESQVSSSGHLDVQLERDVGEGVTAVNQVSCRIQPIEEFRFGLLWEWNLYEAMLYSSYVASRLRTYSENGRQLLDMMLAKAGIPMKQAQLPYIQDMQPRYRHSLQERLAAVAPAFKMSDITFKSFQLQDGPKRCVSAVDAVYAVSALLHSGLKKGGFEGSRDHLEKFNRAYLALSWGDDRGELHRGLDLAKRLQRALIMDGGGVIAQKLFHNFKQFRIYDLSDHKVNNFHLLCHPMALQRLASFFQEQYYHQSGKRKPVILVGPKAENGRCLVIGFEATNRMQGNKLGQAFAEATELVRAQSWHDLFDTSVIEIAHGDVERFKQEVLRVAAELL
ncbi:hypothetical protein N2152v2_001994 [Parachlorella kessleri]